MDNIQPNIRDEALQVAISQLGKAEDPIGSNWGHPIQDYLDSVGISFAAAWCMAFVYWCYKQASISLDIPNPVIETGGVLNCWNKTNPANRIMRQTAMDNPNILLPGYQCIMNFGQGIGHTFFIESVDVSNGLINTIEGNSNTDGSREGYEVVRHQRKISNPLIQGFIKY